MRQRLVLGLLGALLMYALEWLIMIFMFTHKTLMSVFFAVSLLGTDFLVHERDDLGLVLHPSRGLGVPPHAWIRWLINFNLLCYTALGFLMGWMLDRVLQHTSKPR